MPLKLSPMLEEDIDAFGILDELSMEKWTFARLMDTSGRPRREFAAEWARKDWGKDDKAYWMKVTDTGTNEMIAMSMWRMPVEGYIRNNARPAALADADSTIREGMSDAKTLPRRFWEEVEEIKKDSFEEFVGSKVHACQSDLHVLMYGPLTPVDLHLLITHPAHRGRGAGSMLVKWGCDKADRLGIIAACTASADGEAVYKKNGFVVKKAVELDLSPFGYDEIELRRFMVRESVPSETGA